MKHFNNNNKNHQNNRNNKKPSYFDQNRDKINNGFMSPKDISSNTDKIIRDLIYGNINIDRDSDLLCNQMIFTAIYNRVLFLYQYNWAIDTSVSQYIQNNSYTNSIHPCFFQAQSIAHPKSEGYKILLDILEAFRLTGNIQLLKNISLSLKQYRNYL